ncbi:hypothetical protein J1605_010935 [Eschrichtius robustus]|uniref:Uncharacterized protein n=1 Tax=Eschrichtius robustus TaxID=9764 RepID=A0AB34GR62_ESCRO|nr:hypothetical protein J1605_010935 [Eschrichtius robustus]
MGSGGHGGEQESQVCQPCPALVLTCHSEEPSPAGGDASPAAVSTLGVPCLLGAGGPLDSAPALATLSAATRSLGSFPQSLSPSCSARPPPTWELHHLDQFIGASRQAAWAALSVQASGRTPRRAALRGAQRGTSGREEPGPGVGRPGLAGGRVGAAQGNQGGLCPLLQNRKTSCVDVSGTGCCNPERRLLSPRADWEPRATDDSEQCGRHPTSVSRIPGDKGHLARCYRARLWTPSINCRPSTQPRSSMMLLPGGQGALGEDTRSWGGSLHLRRGARSPAEGTAQLCLGESGLSSLRALPQVWLTCFSSTTMRVDGQLAAASHPCSPGAEQADKPLATWDPFQFRCQGLHGLSGWSSRGRECRAPAGRELAQGPQLDGLDRHLRSTLFSEATVESKPEGGLSARTCCSGHDCTRLCGVSPTSTCLRCSPRSQHRCQGNRPLAANTKAEVVLWLRKRSADDREAVSAAAQPGWRGRENAEMEPSAGPSRWAASPAPPPKLTPALTERVEKRPASPGTLVPTALPRLTLTESFRNVHCPKRSYFWGPGERCWRRLGDLSGPSSSWGLALIGHLTSPAGIASAAGGSWCKASKLLRLQTWPRRLQTRPGEVSGRRQDPERMLILTVPPEAQAVGARGSDHEATGILLRADPSEGARSPPSGPAQASPRSWDPLVHCRLRFTHFSLEIAPQAGGVQAPNPKPVAA